MSIVPLWVKLLVVAALVAAAATAFHFWKERIREEGREEIRAEWQAAVKAAELMATAAARRAEIDARARGMQRDKDFGALATRNKALADELAAIRFDPAVIGGLRESVRASNGQSPTVPERSAPAPPGAAVRGPTALEVDDWFQSVAKLYRACREQVIGWIEWDDRRLAK